jgi:thymidylate synthase (FAD)
MTKLSARLIAVTQPVINLQEATPEGVVAFCARVSNPQHQDKPIGSLFDYCIRNKHWSIFEMANAVVEVEAPRDISRQLLRHRSFSFQEFSQRYSDEIEFTEREIRRQDEKNRQNSISDPSLPKLSWRNDSYYLASVAKGLYEWYRKAGVAKECARVILPEGLTMSRIYVNGTLRSYLTYLQVRLDKTTQLEHRLLAEKIKDCLEPVFPQVFGVAEKQFVEAVDG